MTSFSSSTTRHALLACLFLFSSLAGSDTPMEAREKSIYDFTMRDIDGKTVQLSRYRGEVLLIVNVASQCGFTPQYKGLQALYDKYRDKGFAILGFPANNFGGQEPGSGEEIKAFCQRNYGVTFDMFEKISVKGEDQAPFYRFITSDPGVGGDIRWNFQKYLVDRNGKLVNKFPPAVTPMSDEVTSAIERLLQQ